MLEVHKTVISVLVIVCKDYLRNLIIAEHMYIYIHSQSKLQAKETIGSIMKGQQTHSLPSYLLYSPGHLTHNVFYSLFFQSTLPQYAFISLSAWLCIISLPPIQAYKQTRTHAHSIQLAVPITNNSTLQPAVHGSKCGRSMVTAMLKPHVKAPLCRLQVALPLGQCRTLLYKLFLCQN